MQRGNLARDSQSLSGKFRILETLATKLEDNTPDHGYIYLMFVHEFQFLCMRSW